MSLGCIFAHSRMCFTTAERILQECLADPLLHRYSVVFIDEVHERKIAVDLLLGVVKKIRRQRPDLRIIAASATLELDVFVEFFERHEKLRDSEVSQEGESHARRKRLVFHQKKLCVCFIKCPLVMSIDFKT